MASLIPKVGAEMQGRHPKHSSIWYQEVKPESQAQKQFSVRTCVVITLEFYFLCESELRASAGSRDEVERWEVWGVVGIYKTSTVGKRDNVLTSSLQGPMDVVRPSGHLLPRSPAARWEEGGIPLISSNKAKRLGMCAKEGKGLAPEC